MAITEATVCPRNQTMLWGGRARGSVSPKTIMGRETETDYKQGPNGVDLTASWLGLHRLQGEQQGSAKRNCVDIDHIEKVGRWVPSPTDGQDRKKKETDRGSALAGGCSSDAVSVSPGR